MTHSEEIKYWAEHPDNTQVWRKLSDDTEWELVEFPQWRKNHKYIVNNEWAELRKAQEDGKQLEYKNKILNKWVCSTLTIDWITCLGKMHKDWRVKPEKIYEWQWIIQLQNDKYILTDYYIDEDELIESYNGTYKIIDRYEPSKRLRAVEKDELLF